MHHERPFTHEASAGVAERWPLVRGFMEVVRIVEVVAQLGAHRHPPHEVRRDFFTADLSLPEEKMFQRSHLANWFIQTILLNRKTPKFSKKLLIHPRKCDLITSAKLHLSTFSSPQRTKAMPSLLRSVDPSFRHSRTNHPAT